MLLQHWITVCNLLQGAMENHEFWGNVIWKHINLGIKYTYLDTAFHFKFSHKLCGIYHFPCKSSITDY